MWSAWTESIHVYLDATTASARLRRGRWGDAEVRDVDEWTWDARDPASLRMDFGPTLPRGRPVTIYLGTSLLRLATMPAPKDVRDGEERNKIASATLKERLALKPTDWVASVDVANPRATSVVVAAMRKNLMARLQQLAAERSTVLRSVRPYALEALRRYAGSAKEQHAAGTGPCTIAIFENDALTVLVAGNDGYQVASGFAMRAGTANAADELKRLRAGHGLLEHDVLELSVSTGSPDEGARCPFGTSLRADFLERLVVRA